MQSWKKQAIEVIPDFQAIGKLLDVPLGEHVHNQIMPGIQKLKEENRRLRETVIKGLQDIKRAAQVNIDEDDVFNAAETMGDALEKSFILTDALLSAITPPESGEQTKD